MMPPPDIVCQGRRGPGIVKISHSVAARSCCTTRRARPAPASGASAPSPGRCSRAHRALSRRGRPQRCSIPVGFHKKRAWQRKVTKLVLLTMEPATGIRGRLRRPRRLRGPAGPLARSLKTGHRPVFLTLAPPAVFDSRRLSQETSLATQGHQTRTLNNGASDRNRTRNPVITNHLLCR